MMRTIFVVAASLCAPAMANVAGFHWGFDQAPATGLTDVSFPVTLAAKSGVGVGTFSFFQGFSFAGNASDCSIGLTLTGSRGNASLSAFLTTQAGGATSDSVNCQAVPSGGPGLTCEVKISSAATIDKSSYTFVIESLASDGTVLRRWEHGGGHGGGPGGGPGGPFGGGPGGGPGGGGPGGPPGHGGGGPGGPWGGGSGWDNSTKCNTTARAPIARRWWRFGGGDGGGPGHGGSPSHGGGPWGGSNKTREPWPTVTQAPPPPPSGGWWPTETHTPPPRPSGGWWPTGTHAPPPSGGWPKPSGGWPTPSGGWPTPSGGWPTGTEVPKPPFRGAGWPLKRRAADQVLESRDSLNATLWRGCIVDQASQATTVIGIFKLPSGTGGLKPTFTGGVNYPPVAKRLPVVTVEFGNPNTSTPGVSGGAITNPFNVGGWSPISNHTVSPSGISLVL